MRDGEWQISHAGGSFLFGLIDNAAELQSFPELGDPELSTDDSARPRGDGTTFGSDYRSGRTITFALTFARESEAAVRAAVGAANAVWRADELRGTLGGVAELRTRQAGRERVTYGRPRRWAIGDGLARMGVISVLCTFDTVDDLWYDGVESSTVAGIAAGVGGGLLAPLASPLGTTLDSDRSIQIDIGGEVATWLTIEITGQVTSPVVKLLGHWLIELPALNIAEGTTVRFDGRPWARSVTRDGANISGRLTRQSIRPSKAQLKPGAYEVAFSGTSNSGTADLAVSWRNAYTTL